MVHGLDEIIRTRMLMIAAGYDDGNDADTLRRDPMFKLAIGRLAGHSRDLHLLRSSWSLDFRSKGLIVSPMAVRIGVRYRIGVLGALGVVGLMLVGSLYLFSQREQYRMEKSAHTASVVSALFARALTDLAEARQFEVEFRLVRSENQVGQQDVAVESTLKSLARVIAEPDVSKLAEEGAILASEAVKIYARRFTNLVDLQRSVGLSTEDGFACPVGG